MADPVVVIGGGLGGLSAGVALARKGHSVVLLEKEPHVGGYAIAFQRAGYTFDLALHVAPSGGPGEEFDRLAKGLGLDGLAFIRLPESFRVFLKEGEFQVPNNYEGLFERLGEAFPAERDGLAAFRRNLEGHARVYSRLFDATVPKWRSVPPFLPRLPLFLRHTTLPVDRYAARFLRDRRVLSILFQCSAFMGVPPSEFPTITFMMMFHLLFTQGIYTIQGGGQSLTSALERRFRALGGKVVTRQAAARVLLRERAAVAVRTADGSEFAASGVVCGVSIPALVHDLIGAEHFPASYRRTLAALRPSVSASVVNLGLDCHPRDVGITNHISILLPDDDIDVCLKRQRDSRLLEGFAVTSNGASDPAAPVGLARALSVVGQAELRHWQGLSDAAYRAAKEEMIDDALAKIERRFPGLRSHVQFRCAATPRTMARYTGNPDGAILGFDTSCGMHRRVMAVSRTPFDNVVVAGAWTDRLGGFMPSVKAGVEAAERLARRLA